MKKSKNQKKMREENKVNVTVFKKENEIFYKIFVVVVTLTRLMLINSTLALVATSQ